MIYDDVRFINPDDKPTFVYGRKYEMSFESFDQLYPELKDIYLRDFVSDVEYRGYVSLWSAPKIDIGDSFVEDKETGETYRIKIVNVWSICTKRHNVNV